MLNMLYNKIVSKEEKIAVIGLGYVGLPLAAAFAAKGLNVIGFDTDNTKIEKYKHGSDVTNEVGDEAVRNTAVKFTSDETELRGAKFHIVAVPTPVNQDKKPDLSCVMSASEIIGRNLAKGSVIVYESTVYPGATENVCVPIIEKQSGYKAGIDFKVGYSPERINPADKIHKLENIKKIISGMDEESLTEIKNIYGIIIEAGTHAVSNIKTAEAIKVAESSQRDINIAFMNELAMVFDRMGIDTTEVVEGMNTKWNALGFRPGLVGGHCVGIDPYYFAYEAENLGHHSRLILSGREINDGMGEFIANVIIKQMVLAGKTVKNSKVVILGITFKENCSDIRNSKVEDIIKRLEEYGITPAVVDPAADIAETKKEYNVELIPLDKVKDADCVVIAVAHDMFKRMTFADIDKLYGDFDNSGKVLIDVKSIFDKKYIESAGYRYWRL